jgi:hypothetical protein
LRQQTAGSRQLRQDFRRSPSILSERERFFEGNRGDQKANGKIESAVISPISNLPPILASKTAADKLASNGKQLPTFKEPPAGFLGAVRQAKLSHADVATDASNLAGRIADHEAIDVLSLNRAFAEHRVEQEL